MFFDLDHSFVLAVISAANVKTFVGAIIGIFYLIYILPKGFVSVATGIAAMNRQEEGGMQVLGGIGMCLSLPLVALGLHLIGLDNAAIDISDVNTALGR